MPLNVFRLYFTLPDGSRPGFPIVTGISANCIHCSYGISQQSADWLSLFIFRLFRVTLLFVIYLFAFYLSQFGSILPIYFSTLLLFYIYISTIIPRRLTVFLSQSFPLIVFISYHSLAIIDVAGFTLVTSPISVALFFPEAPRACYIFELVLSRVIDRQCELRTANGERFEDSESAITMFTVIIRFRRNY